MLLSEIKRDDRFEGFLIVRSAEQRAAASGKNYLDMTLADRSGSITGYISASYLSPSKPKTDSAPTKPSPTTKPSTPSAPTYSPDMSNAKKLEYVIYVAQSLTGRPYASNANVPYSFDCSRFVRYCFQQIDVTLDASAKDQGYDESYTRINSTGSLKTGDVVVFNTNSSDSDSSDHTGIYIGNGYFIHASSSAGKVIVSTLASGYYNNTFSWGLRILE